MIQSALLFEVKRFAIHDGPGVRTVLFLKGCPLKCRWCHNPESLSSEPQLAYYEHKCIDCGECVSACPNQAHELIDGEHRFNRSKCNMCGACEESCLGRALKLFGKKVTVEEAAKIALEDRDFFEPDGGVTISGGESLMRADFCAELFKILKTKGIHCAIDTAGAVSWRKFETVLPYTDMFLYDLKHVDDKRHLEYVGASNRLILENLERLSQYGIPIEIRIPLIPGFNDDIESIVGIAEKLGKLQNITDIKLLPYHDFARSKYKAIGLPDTMPKVDTISDAQIKKLKNVFHNYYAPTVTL